MIFGNIEDKGQYVFLTEAVIECLTYAKEHSLLNYEKGSHEIDGKRIYVNIAEYTTTAPENRFWEAHREYLDIHLMLRGQEQIDLNFIRNMSLGEYVPEDDFQALDGEKNCSVILREGGFVICFPEEGHRTAVEVNGPETLKKAIFKVHI